MGKLSTAPPSSPEATRRAWPSRGQNSGNPWNALWAMMIGFFMIMIDSTIVAVANPTIMADLGTGYDAVVWVTSAYLLGYAVVLLVAGRLGDRFGSKHLYLIGLVVFTAASIWCGLSGSVAVLIAARVVQGVGAGILTPQTLSTITQIFPPQRRGVAMSVWGATAGVASLVGPLAGGALVDGLGWQWIFFINVPIGFVAIIITLTQIQESRDANKRRIDWIGFVTFSASGFLFVFAMIRGNDDGWSSSLIVGLLVVASALIVIFVVAELKQKEPMLDLNLFKRPAMTGVSLAAFAISASIFAMFLYLTLFIQDDLGYGALASGVRFLPLTALAFIVAPVAGKLTVRVHARYMLGSGLLLIAAGLFTMGFTHANSTWTVLLPGFILAGVGIGAVNPVLASSAISVVPPERSGMASGANSTFRQVGIATGIAGLGSVFQSQLEKKTVQALRVSHTGTAISFHGGAQLRAAVLGGDVRHLAASLPGPDRIILLNAYRSGFSSSLNTIVFIASIIALAGSIGSFALVRQRDFVPSVAPKSH